MNGQSSDSIAGSEKIGRTGILGTLRKHIQVPHTYIILIFLVCVAVGLTYVIPAGEFNRVKDAVSGKMVIDPLSFHPVKANPAQLLSIPVKLFTGLMKAADIMFFVLILGGAFEILNGSKMIGAFTGHLAMKLRGRESWVIPIFLSIFSVGGFTMGMSAEVMVFVPIGIIMARSLGFDVVIGTAMVMLGANIGYTAGLLNPFGVGLAQIISQVPLFSGMWLRIILLLVLIVITTIYLLRYAKAVKKDPSKSIIAGVAGISEDFTEKDAGIPDIRPYHYLVLTVLVGSFGVLIWGISVKNWWIPEMAAVFLMMGILAGFASGYGPSRIAQAFSSGAQTMIGGALVIGLARGIMVVMEDAKIMDSIVFMLSNSIGNLPPSLQLMGMYAAQTTISLILVSSSGQAAVTMPILAPLADLLHVSRQTAVLLFQCSDGFTNDILPTSAATMGALSVAKIPYERWFKFMLPLLLIYLVVGGIFILIAHAIGY